MTLILTLTLTLFLTLILTFFDIMTIDQMTFNYSDSTTSQSFCTISMILHHYNDLDLNLDLDLDVNLDLMTLTFNTYAPRPNDLKIWLLAKRLLKYDHRPWP